MAVQYNLDVFLSCMLHDQATASTITIPQFHHRTSLVDLWSVPPRSRILDIGCGQGEPSLVLALAVGANGHITGIDTCLPDYGGPYTVAQSQSYILKSSLGSRLSFLRTDVANHLSFAPKTTKGYDSAVLCHSLWYFPSRDDIISMFRSLAHAGIQHVFLAEYAFQATLPEQVPHVLAAKAQALLHAYKAPREAGTREPNVRAAPDVDFIMRAVESAGYRIDRQGVFTPGDNLREGHWESKFVQMDMFRGFVERENLAKGQKEEVLSYALKAKKEIELMRANGGEIVRTMDVWWAAVRLDS